jgi:hypothetical protein
MLEDSIPKSRKAGEALKNAFSFGMEFGKRQRFLPPNIFQMFGAASAVRQQNEAGETITEVGDTLADSATSTPDEKLKAIREAIIDLRTAAGDALVAGDETKYEVLAGTAENMEKKLAKLHEQRIEMEKRNAELRRALREDKPDTPISLPGGVDAAEKRVQSLLAARENAREALEMARAKSPEERRGILENRRERTQAQIAQAWDNLDVEAALKGEIDLSGIERALLAETEKEKPPLGSGLEDFFADLHGERGPERTVTEGDRLIAEKLDRVIEKLPVGMRR